MLPNSIIRATVALLGAVTICAFSPDSSAQRGRPHPVETYRPPPHDSSSTHRQASTPTLTVEAKSVQTDLAKIGVDDQSLESSTPQSGLIATKGDPNIVERLLNVKSRYKYVPELAVALYRLGYDPNVARDLAKDDLLQDEWARIQSGRSRQDKNTFRNFVERLPEAHRVADQERRRIADETLEEKAAPFEKRRREVANLPTAILSSLASASRARTAVLDPLISNVVVKLTDDPSHDRQIIDHIWFKHAVALSLKVNSSKLHVLNLFSDPVGDSLFTEITNQLNRGRVDTSSSTDVLNGMLTGARSFDQAKLTAALRPLAGQTIYIVGHIPEALPGEGNFEYLSGRDATRIRIQDIARAFALAGVNFHPVGCASANHNAIGFDKTINNVDALTGFLGAINEPGSRSLLQWHATFTPPNTKLVLDPVAAQFFDQPPLTGITVVSDGKQIGNGYVGTYAAPPPSSQATSLPPSLALLLIDNKIELPFDARDCLNGRYLQQGPTSKWLPWSTVAMIFAYLCGMALAWERKPSIRENVEEVCFLSIAAAVFMAPAILVRSSWEHCSSASCTFSPGIGLPIWCLLYALVAAGSLLVFDSDKPASGNPNRSGIVWLNRERKLCIALILCWLGAAAFALAAYAGLGADAALVALCATSKL